MKSPKVTPKRRRILESASAVGGYYPFRKSNVTDVQALVFLGLLERRGTAYKITADGLRHLMTNPSDGADFDAALESAA